MSRRAPIRQSAPAAAARRRIDGVSCATRLALLALPLLIAPRADAASGLRDEATGLALSLPAPYETHRIERSRYDVAFAVSSSGPGPSHAAGDPYLCIVGFKADPDNAGMSQAAINRLTRRVGRAQTRAHVATFGQVESETSFTHRGVAGLEFLLKPRNRPAEAGELVLLSVIDTRAGRVVCSCAGRRAEAPRVVTQFRSIRAAIGLPRPPGAAR